MIHTKGVYCPHQHVSTILKTRPALIASYYVSIKKEALTCWEEEALLDPSFVSQRLEGRHSILDLSTGCLFRVPGSDIDFFAPFIEGLFDSF